MFLIQQKYNKSGVFQNAQNWCTEYPSKITYLQKEPREYRCNETRKWGILDQGLFWQNLDFICFLAGIEKI